jgi:hypothetical protein
MKRASGAYVARERARTATRLDGSTWARAEGRGAPSEDPRSFHERALPSPGRRRASLSTTGAVLEPAGVEPWECGGRRLGDRGCPRDVLPRASGARPPSGGPRVPFRPTAALARATAVPVPADAQGPPPVRGVLSRGQRGASPPSGASAPGTAPEVPQTTPVVLPRALRSRRRPALPRFIEPDIAVIPRAWRPRTVAHGRGPPALHAEKIDPHVDFCRISRSDRPVEDVKATRTTKGDLANDEKSVRRSKSSWPAAIGRAAGLCWSEPERK